MRRLMDATGTSTSTTVVKVTGTNGKGSVCAIVDACLRAQGLRTGLFTSPHLSRWTERIRIDGTEITAADLDNWSDDLADALQRSDLTGAFAPTVFEMFLLLALRGFQRRNTEAIVLEAGIGGSYDATSAIDGPIAAISSVASDHVSELGPTISDIARNKAGIASPGSTLVLAPTISAEAVDVIRKEAAANGTRVRIAALENLKCVVSTNGSSYEFSWKETSVCGWLSLPGRFQIGNMSTAAAILDELSPKTVQLHPSAFRGTAEVRWPGRFEVLSNGPSGLTWILDVAHNRQGMEAFVESLMEQSSATSFEVIYGAAADKNFGETLDVLLPHVRRIHLVTGFYKSAPAGTVTNIVPPTKLAGVHDSPLSAFKSVHGLPGGVVIVTGSLYLVGMMRDLILERHA